MNNQQRAENAIKWIERLLKTRAKQGRNRMGDKFSGRCCLAIGCDEIGIQYDSMDNYSEKFADEVGLLKEEGNFVLNGEIDLDRPCLTRMNDFDMLSFKEIGKQIIESPEGRFRPGVAKLIKKHFAEV